MAMETPRLIEGLRETRPALAAELTAFHEDPKEYILAMILETYAGRGFGDFGGRISSIRLLWDFARESGML